VSIPLNLILTKPISIFAWWLYAGANRTTFWNRAKLARRVKQARRAGRPVLFVSNHLSMFDDPVLPMGLFRTGPRAAAEIGLLATVLILWQVTPPTILSPGAVLSSVAACCLGSALLGARKTWWSTADLINFSGASTLRSKMEVGRDRPLSIPVRVLLAVADPLIFLFMRSATVKSVLVDRRPGEESRRSRTRALETMIDLATHGEQIWVFFEGGRTRNPNEIQPARAGVGQVIESLRTRGIRPVVIAIHHRGLEHVMPMSSSRCGSAAVRLAF
jgi:1-acyl-sn-glycerol-3-phosphate acyltransferase